MANSGSERIIHRGMTQGAVDSDRFHPAAVWSKESFYTDDGVQFHQRERRRRIIEIDLALFYLLDQIGGQRFGIHF